MNDSKSKQCLKNTRLNSKLINKLNLNYTKWSNKTYTVGDRDMLYVVSPSKAEIDYLALYSKPSEYHKTANTAVCFYEYDKVFDGQKGLWNSIYYDDKKRLKEYKDRFSGVKYFIMPDYSMFGDGLDTSNANNLQRARIVSIWLLFECNALVIPNITYAEEKSFKYMFDGLEDCKIVAFSTKGSMSNTLQLRLLEEAINYTVERLPKLNTIIVYSVTVDDLKTLSVFRKAIDKDIRIIIPNNLLKERNLNNGGRGHGTI